MFSLCAPSKAPPLFIPNYYSLLPILACHLVPPPSPPSGAISVTCAVFPPCHERAQQSSCISPVLHPGPPELAPTQSLSLPATLPPPPPRQPAWPRCGRDHPDVSAPSPTAAMRWPPTGPVAVSTHQSAMWGSVDLTASVCALYVQKPKAYTTGAIPAA